MTRIATLLVAIFILALPAKASGPPPWPRPIVIADSELQKQNDALRKDRNRWKRSANYHARLVRQLQRHIARTWRPHVMHAIALASTIWHVPQGELVSVGNCESHLNPFATNGIFRGVFQEGPMFEAGPFRSFGVFDAYANVFTAAYTVARQGWRQWECKP